MITVKKLKEIIEHLPDDMLVILQKDPEGNDYNGLSGGDTDAVATFDSDHGLVEDVYNLRHGAEGNMLEDDEWEQLKQRPRVLVLWPES